MSCFAVYKQRVIRGSFGFALLRSMIGQENSCHHLNQSNSNKKFKSQLGQSRFPALSAGCKVFNLSSHRSMMMLTFFFLNGNCN